MKCLTTFISAFLVVICQNFTGSVVRHVKDIMQALLEIQFISVLTEFVESEDYDTVYIQTTKSHQLWTLTCFDGDLWS